MPPLSESIKTHFQYERHDEKSVYTAAIDPEWMIGSVPNGGYLLALITSAAINYTTRKHPSHPDPAHLSAQFLSATSAGKVEIHINTFSTAKRWTRLQITLYQRNEKDLSRPHTRISVWMLFTDLPELGVPALPSPEDCTVLPNTPSPFARMSPLKVDPGSVKLNRQPSVFNFNKYFRWAQGKQMFGTDSPAGDDVGSKKMEWGAWLQLTGDTENTGLATMIPFFADMFMNGPELLPAEQQPPEAWYPTMTFSLHFHAKFPLKPTPTSSSTSLPIAKRTIGLYALSNFIHQGRHDMTVEVWSAPSELGEKCKMGSDEWRKGSQILAVSTQVRDCLAFG